MHTWFAAAADPRIAAAVPLIGVQVVFLICQIVNLGAKSSLPWVSVNSFVRRGTFTSKKKVTSVEAAMVTKYPKEQGIRRSHSSMNFMSASYN